MNSTAVLRLTEEDFNRLTPDQRREARHLLNSSGGGREAARRYIATIIQSTANPPAQEKRRREEVSASSLSRTTESMRDGMLFNLAHPPAILLSKIKPLIFREWKGREFITTKEVAQFYEVPIATVRSAVIAHREELEKAGMKVIIGRNLKQLRRENEELVAGVKLTTWTPNATIRVGLILRPSKVTGQLRGLLRSAKGDGGIPMSIQEFKGWVARYIYRDTIPQEDWPALAQALREIADETDRHYQAIKGEQP